MASMRVDCAPVRIRDDAELDRYMDGSAAAVGRIMAPLLGARPRPRGGRAPRRGLPARRTSCATSREDWALDRIYLPGLAEDELARGRPATAFRERVARQVDRARAMFAETAPATDARAVRRHVPRAQRLRARARPGRAHGYDVMAPGAVAPWEGVRAAAGSCCAAMTERATARGAERTSLDGTRADVLICGASFAGLAVARELAGSGADVLLVDRYEIGERATSACAAPDAVAARDGRRRSIRQSSRR